MAEVEPTRYKGVPLRAENQVDFYRDFAPAVREYGLENAVKAVIDISEGYGVYEDLRKNAGQNDLEIIQRYVDLPKIDLPIQSIRQEGIAEDDVVNIFLEDLGLNKKTDLLDKGIDPKEFLQAFVKGRTLTDMEAIKEGGIRGAIVGTPAVAGMTIGATLGAPFFPPVGSIVAGGIGLIGGAVAGTEIEEAVMPTEPILNDRGRAILEGSKVITEGVTGMGAPKAFLKVGEKALESQAGFLNTLGDSIRLRSFNQRMNPVFQPGVMPDNARYLLDSDPVLFKFLQTYKRNPILFQGAEAMGVMGAGLGAGLAEDVDPGSVGTRVAMEAGFGAAASFVNPFRVIPYFFTAKDAIAEDGAELVSNFGEDAVKQRVGFALNEFLTLRGEDPKELIEKLRSPEFSELLSRAGEEYQGTIRPLLEAQNLPAPNSRAITNSSTLELIEGRLRSLNGRFGADIQNQLDSQVENISSLIDALRFTGGKNAIRQATQLRQRHFEDLVSQRLQHALAKSELATSRIDPNDVEAKNRASKVINDVIESAFKDVRRQEDVLYRAVPKTISVGYDNFVTTVEREIDKLTPELVEELFPKPVRARYKIFGDMMEQAELDAQIAADRATLDQVIAFSPDQADQFQQEFDKLVARREALGEAIEPPTYEQMDNFRGFLLEEARNARSNNPKPGASRLYSNLAEGIRQDMTDLEALRELNGTAIADDALAAVDQAKAYGKAMRDVFRRAFPQEVFRQKASGEDAIDPTLLYQRIIQGTDDATRLKMNQIDESVQFLVNDLTRGGLAGDPTEELVASARSGMLQDSYDTIMRAVVNNPTIINPETGAVNTRQLAAFLERNEQTLDRLPQLRADLQNAGTRQTLLNQARAQEKSNYGINKAYVTRLIGNLTGEKPVDAINQILGSNSPTRGITNLVRQLRRAAEKAEKGEAVDQAGRRVTITVDQVDAELRDAVFEAANQFATSAKDSITDVANFQRMNTFFFNPRGKEAPLIDSLVKSGLFTMGERVRLKKLLTAGEGAQKKISSPSFDPIEDIESGGDVLTNLLVRATGAGAGTKLAKILPGNANLIAASGGSQAALKLLDAIPTTSTNKVLMDAIKDPEYLALLLEKGTLNDSMRQGAGSKAAQFAKKVANVRRLNVYIKNTFGITAGQQLGADELTEEESRSLQEFQETPFGTFGPTQPRLGRPDSRAIMPRRRPSPTPAPPPAPPVPPPAQAAATPPTVDRQRYAALYPNDPISALIDVQGIGALPQAPRV